MPRPLPSPDTQESALYGFIAEHPLDPVARLVLADWLEEHDRPLKAEVIRLVETVRRRCGSLHLARPDELERLRGMQFAEAECAAVAQDIRTLLANMQRPNGTDIAVLEARISAALGTPDPDAPPPDLRTPEGLQVQYDVQSLLWTSLDVLEDHNGSLGITGIDTNVYCVPPLSAIAARLATPELRRKIEQGFDTLLLVPFGLPVERLVEALEKGLRRNGHLFEGRGAFDVEEPVYLNSEDFAPKQWQGPDEDGRLVSFPERFGWRHGGRTKSQILQEAPNAGWQVFLVEGALTDIPSEGEGKVIAGRAQLQTGSTPEASLHSLLDGEIGWTLETYVAAFLTQLERGGRVLDLGTRTYLLASYFPKSYAQIPFAGWSLDFGQVQLDASETRHAESSDGARAAVRVL